MKIWGDIPSVSGVYGRQGNVKKIDKAAGITSKKDVVSISRQGKEYQTAIKALRDVPDVREDKLSSLIEVMRSGSYDVKGNDIADKMINSILDKRV